MLELNKAVTKITTSIRSVLNIRSASAVALLLTAIVEPALAQEFTLPTVDITGVDSDSTATEIVVAIIKYGFSMALWIFVLIAGGVFIKNTVKSVAKVRREEEGKWGDVISDVAGNAIVVVLTIALATWVSSLLN